MLVWVRTLKVVKNHEVVVSKMFYFHPYLGKWFNLTNIFRMGWNHQLGKLILQTTARRGQPLDYIFSNEQYKVGPTSYK